MFNCLYTIPLCNFGIAFSHAICVIVNYFGKLLLKTIWQPKASPIFYHPGENRSLKSSTVLQSFLFNVRFALWELSNVIFKLGFSRAFDETVNGDTENNMCT